MLTKMPQCNLLRAVGVAVFAEVGASVVFADVLADDAPAELTLAFVLVVPMLDNSLFRIEKVSTGDFNAQKLHQAGIIGEVLYHQIIVDAFVVHDAVSVNVNLLSASGQCVAPCLVQLLNASSECGCCEGGDCGSGGCGGCGGCNGGGCGGC